MAKSSCYCVVRILSSCFTNAKLPTLIWTIFLYIFGGFGIAGGVHKFWCHRSFKAKLPFRVFVAQTVAHQDDILKWSREQRVHHKFSDTDADPYNSRRGFFFSHIGWLMHKKHPELYRVEKTIDVSDLLQDPVVVFQQKYYYPLACILCFAMPAVVPDGRWISSLYLRHARDKISKMTNQFQCLKMQK